jgi:hypothetical protein
MNSIRTWALAAASTMVFGAACSGAEDGSAPPTRGMDAGGAETSAPGSGDSADRAVESALDDRSEASSEDAPFVDEAADATNVETGIADASTDTLGNVMAPPPPATLSATGLFTGLNSDGSLKLAAGVEPFEPKYALWSDGASKARWVYLPPGEKIDTSDPDHWSFPTGTKFWKEFAVAGKRVETRLIHKYGPGADDYLFAAYQWKAGDAGGATDATLANPDDGVLSANGTSHDIPPQKDCVTCHGPLREHVLGFGALQLAHTKPGVNDTTLERGARFARPLPSNLEFPGSDAKSRDALGYLHANCGNCHNTTPGVFMIPEPRMDLRVRVGETLEQTGAYRTALNVEVTKFHHPTGPTITYRIAGGDTTRSCVSFRMADLAKDNRMPPLATKVSDTQGIAAVNGWIATLPAPPDQ